MNETSLSAPDRDELRAELERRCSPGQAHPPWPGIQLDELLHRVGVEAEQAYAPLLAALHDAQRAAA